MYDIIHDIIQFSTALIALVTLLTARHAAVISASNSKKLEEVHKETNSMKDQLVEAVRVGAMAKGIAAGRNQVIAEQGEKEEKKAK